MGKTIDKKVVEMSFDNSNFEKNVKTSLSTLDKLKAKLNFSGMSKGLEQLSQSANRVSFTGLTNGIDQVGLKFDALYTTADQAMRRITNSIMDFGLNIGKQLIIDPKKLGFEEYELKMQSVQTIMASSKESLETVNKYLEQLNEYSDKTIYSFQDMTNNIGKFTNAGVKLQDAVDAIKGVSNEAALSGANANEASRAMYNFAQALSAGYVKLIDWKSIENANMATKEFKDELIKTALEMGTLQESTDGMYKTLEGEAFNSINNFNDSLKDQWMTSEVLITTLKKYANEETDIGIRAIAAAQDVKTFSMLIDTLKEAVQSGWAKSFEIIFGDFNEAKKLWTNVSNVLGKVIDNIADIRNKYLSSFLGKTFTKTYQSMVDAFSSVKESTDGLKEAIKTVADYSQIVDEIINGIWGNGQDRWDRLSEAGYDWAHAQNLVNEKLGFSLRRQTQYSESAEEVAESTEQVAESTEDLIVNLAEAYKKSEQKQKLNEKELNYLEQYNKLNAKQQEAIREVLKLSNRLGMPVKELISNMDKINGKWLLFESFGNIGNSIITIFKAIGKAWVEVFPPEDAADSLFNITTVFYKLTRVIKDFLGEINDQDGIRSNAENILSIFKALFSVIGLLSDLISGAFSIAINLLGIVLGKAIDPSSSLLDILGEQADKISYNIKVIRDYIKEESLFGKITDGIVKSIRIFVDKTKNFIQTNETAQKILAKISEFLIKIKTNLKDLIDQLTATDGVISKVLDHLFGGFGKWLDGLKDTNNIPMYIIEGLINGLSNGIPKVYELINNIAQNIISIFCKVLRIASPSKIFFSIGKFIMLGLVLGMASQYKPLQNIELSFLSNIINFGDSIKNSVLNVFTGIANTLKGIDYKNLFKIALSGAFIYLAKRLTDTADKILNIANSITAPLKSFANLIDGVKNSVASFMKDLGTAKKMEAIKDVIKGMALSMLMIAASMYIISKIDSDRLAEAGLVCAVMAGVLVSLYFLIDKLATGGTGVGGGIDVKAKKATFNIGPIIGLSIALLAMAVALKKLSTIDFYSLENAVMGMLVVIASIEYLLLSIGTLSKLLKLEGKQLADVGKAIRKIAASLLLMLLVIKLASKISQEEVEKAIYSLGLATGLFSIFLVLSKFSGQHANKAALLIGALTLSLLGMIGIIKIAAALKPREITRGMLVIGGIVTILSMLIMVSELGQHANKAAAIIVGFGLSILGIVVAIKILAGIPMDGIIKASLTLSAISIVLTGLILISKFAGKNAIKAGAMLLMVSGALLVLSGVIFILSTMSIKSLVKGISVIGIISSLLVGLIMATEKSKDAANTVKSLLITMSVLLAFVIALSSIKLTALLAATSSIVAIMMALELLIKSTDKINKKSIVSLAEISAILVVVLGAMAYIIYKLAKTNPKSALASAASLSILLVTMSVVLTLLTKIGPKAEKATTGLFMLTIMTLIVGALGVVISLLAKLNPKKTIDLVISLSTMLLTMAGVLAILTLIGTGQYAAFIGIAALVTLIATFGGMIAAFAALNKFLPGVAKFLKSGIPILTAIGNAIGAFFGSIITGFGKEVLTLLPALGTALSLFMVGLTPFLVGSKMIDKDLVSRVGSLSLAIVALSAAEFISAIVNIMSGKHNLGSFGKELSAFMTNLKGFIKGSKNITPEVATAIKNLSEAILALSASRFLDAIPILGKKSFESFGNSLSKLGEGLSSFADSVKDIENIDTIKKAAEAIKLIAEAADTIPNEGGVLAKFVGENTGSSFKEHMLALADGIVGFANKLEEGNFTKDSANLIGNACKAIKNIAKVADEIPNAGGKLAEFIGDNPLDKFADQLPIVAKGLIGFITEMNKGQFTEDSQNLVNIACTAIESFTKLNDSIPNAGGILAKFFGEKSLSNFASNLPLLGTSLSGFVSNLNIKNEDLDKISIASTMISSIASLFAFGANIKIEDTFFKKFGEGIASFIKSISVITKESIENAITNTRSILEFIRSFKDIDTSPLSNLASSLKSAGEKGIKGFVSSFENQDYKTKVNNAAKALGKSAINGVKAEVGEKKGNNIGKNFVLGFVNGINENKQQAINASTELGIASAKALKKSTKEKSPSKLTYEIGKFFDLGFVNGIKEFAKNVYSASSDVGDTAKLGISNAISRITDIISEDSEYQPTISPVLDLSDIESGANQINSIFDNKNVGIGANINAISSAMRTRNQDITTNKDVINAIDRLNSSMIDQKPGNTYNLNGITYNDDSPIANAVSALINAIEVEGRV